jgi:hypothetical protein
LRHGGVAEVWQAENVLDGAQQRVVVVADGADGAGPDERGQQDRPDAAAAGPFFPGSSTFGCAGPRLDVSPQQAAESLPSPKVITMRPPSRKGGEAMIFGTHWARNLSAWVSSGAGARWPQSARVRCCRHDWPAP